MSNVREVTLVLVKQDGIQRGLVGLIISRLENRGYKLIGIKSLQPSKELLENHYGQLKGKDFYDALLSYALSGPAVAMVWEGRGVILAVRALFGDTDPTKALPGTIRGDYATSTGRNLVHSSDSEAAAKREVDLWFKPDELLNYHRSNAEHLHDKYVGNQ